LWWIAGHALSSSRGQLTPYAMKFAEAGFAVSTYNYRFFGERDGNPRQIINIKKQWKNH
jgi:hypothetical protein